MTNFFEVRFPSLGLDISDHSVKVASMVGKNNTLRLASFGEARLDAGTILQGKIQDAAKVAEAIRRALEGAKGRKIEERYAVCGLPEEQAFLRVIQLPKLPAEELGRVVGWEIEANLPMPLDQVYYDWHVIQEAAGPDGTPHFDVIFAAVPRIIIDAYIDAIQRAGLIPLAFDVESAATARAILQQDISYPPILIIDFGETSVGLAIFSGQTLRVTSTATFGGQKFNDLIASGARITLEEAEKRKIAFGLDTSTPQGKANFDAVVPILEKLLVEIREYMKFYRTHASHEHSVYTLSVAKTGQDSKFNFKRIAGEEIFVAKQAEGTLGVTKILFCGGEANLQGLVDFFASRLNIDTRPANPLTNLSSDPKHDLGMSERDKLRFATAIGLALRSHLE